MAPGRNIWASKCILGILYGLERSINKVSNAYKSSYFVIYMLFQPQITFLQSESLCRELCDWCPSENLPMSQVCLNGCQAMALYMLHCNSSALFNRRTLTYQMNHSHKIKLLLHIAMTYVKWTMEDFLRTMSSNVCHLKRIRTKLDFKKSKFKNIVFVTEHPLHYDNLYNILY